MIILSRQHTYKFDIVHFVELHFQFKSNRICQFHQSNLYFFLKSNFTFEFTSFVTFVRAQVSLNSHIDYIYK